MINGMLSYRIEGMGRDGEWYVQESGNNLFGTIMKSWQSWISHVPDPTFKTRYRLILEVTQDIILTDTEW